MRRDQLEHAIRTACQIIEQPEVIIVGSQAILGTYDEKQLPPAATMSIEIDVLPIADDNATTARLADLIEGVAGEFSSFEELHGFSIDASTSPPPSSPTVGESVWPQTGIWPDSGRSPPQLESLKVPQVAAPTAVPQVRCRF